MKPQVRLLESPDERAEFCRRYTAASGTLLLPAQVQGCQILGFWREGELRGGLGLRVDGPYRAYQAISPDYSPRPESGLVEVTGLWADPSLRNTRDRSFVIAMLLLRARSLGARRLLGITTKASLWEKTYRPMGARIRYQGPVELEAGKRREGIVFEMAILPAFFRIPLYLIQKKRSSNMQTSSSSQNPYTGLNQPERLAKLSGRLQVLWAEQQAASAFLNRIMGEKVDPALYRLYMIETFHYTFHNARNQALVGVRAQGVSPRYVKFCFEHAEEETGHELMALHDVQSMGGEKIAANDLPAPLPETETLVAYLYWISAFGNPLQRLGYSFWAEDVYGFIAPQLGKLQKDLALKDSQMTFFRAHSTIDQAHADEVREVILENCKTADDWAAVERVMECSLSLTMKMTDAILRAYDAARVPAPAQS